MHRISKSYSFSARFMAVTTLLKNFSLLGYLALYTCKQVPTFRRSCACNLMHYAPQRRL